MIPLEELLVALPVSQILEEARRAINNMIPARVRDPRETSDNLPSSSSRARPILPYRNQLPCPGYCMYRNTGVDGRS